MKKLLGIVVLSLLCFNVSIANIEEGKIHLACKVLNSSDIAGSPLNYEKEFLYVINIEDGEYERTGTTKKSHVEIMENYIFEYNFSNTKAEIRMHVRDLGSMEIVTAKNFSEALYQKSKLKLDKINSTIKGYKPKFQNNYEIYNVSNLGSLNQENDKYTIIMKTLNYLRMFDVIKKTGNNDTEEKNFQLNHSYYKCNGTDGFK